MPECRRCGVALGPTESHLCGTCWWETEDDCDEMAEQDEADDA